MALRQALQHRRRTGVGTLGRCRILHAVFQQTLESPENHRCYRIPHNDVFPSSRQNSTHEGTAISLSTRLALSIHVVRVSASRKL